ncbi:MAG: DNA polymerase III subunit gamma/tau, partial [Clostridia bacterium]|nr:DNA polymerase III subunit gamma/tau [Clostridia bacterium]
MYYALYRKYRPLSFGDVLGQDAITETLRRQVSTGQISHAYLFTGTRGTGKTTCAKILARAVNCQNPIDGNPCNECAICKGLLDGTLYDVEEIDAASNNGVENIRQIREEVVYAPTAAKYKVYIIDEVHMLSQGAFNALLKTLEEPPAHALFILATTEIHKVPATILSRCQRFDFLRLPKKTLVDQFRSVLANEGKSLDENSLDLIAELADGSSRDGLSILDKVIDLETFEQVEAVLGVIPKRRIFDLLTAIADGDTDTLYRAVEDMYNASADLGRLCTSMMDVMKDVMIFRSAKQPENLLEKSESDVIALTAIA